MVLAASAWGWIRDRVGRSVLHHPVVEVFRAAAPVEGWTLLQDEIQRPGRLEPLWLAGMMEEPWQRTLMYRTHQPPDRSGPRVECLLFGAPGGPPEGPVEGIVWRSSRTLPFISGDAQVEEARGGPRGSFVGLAQEITFLDRARSFRVALDGELVVVIVEGGKRRTGGDGYGHPLNSTEPHDWGPPPPSTGVERDPP